MLNPQIETGIMAGKIRQLCVSVEGNSLVEFGRICHNINSDHGNGARIVSHSIVDSTAILTINNMPAQVLRTVVEILKKFPLEFSEQN